MLEELKIKIVGISPLLMHNGQTSDPLNRFSKQLKAVSSKRKKSDEDYEEMARIEWHAVAGYGIARQDAERHDWDRQGAIGPHRKTAMQTQKLLRGFK